MTKEELFSKWGSLSISLKNDLELVIAYEIAKVQEAKLKHADQVTDQVTDQVQNAKPFDKDRFEAMFRAVVANGGHELCHKQAIELTEEALAKLDAYYASKQGGNNE